jgi:hypothetical protein
MLTLTSEKIPKPFKGLVDSGSSHCFLERKFVSEHSLPTIPVDPLPLALIDGSVNTVISEAVMLPIVFPTEETHNLMFYVTPLDSTCSVVLGHNWLTRYNPLIDWVLGTVLFRDPEHEQSNHGKLSASNAFANELSAETLDSSTSQPPNPSEKASRPSVSLVNAIAFQRACEQKGSQVFQLDISSPELRARGVSPKNQDPHDTLKGVPPEYHDFTNVFSKKRADTLAPHRPYGLKINLEEGTSPPLGPMYSLSSSETLALREFIDENLAIGFIRPSTSSHGAPVLFVHKKDSSLRLCVNFRGLNRITKKD